jgi:single-strand DNA-binding protein
MHLLNSVNLTGRLTKDPQVSYTPSGVPVASFTLAVNRIFKRENEENTDFIRCVCVNKTAEIVGKSLRKGSFIAVEGRIQSRTYEKDGKREYITEVFITQLHFLEKKSTDNGHNPPPPNYQNQYNR